MFTLFCFVLLFMLFHWSNGDFAYWLKRFVLQTWYFVHVILMFCLSHLLILSSSFSYSIFLILLFRLSHFAVSSSSFWCSVCLSSMIFVIYFLLFCIVLLILSRGPFVMLRPDLNCLYSKFYYIFHQILMFCHPNFMFVLLFSLFRFSHFDVPSVQV